MDGKHRKVQVVLAARDPQGVWSFLLFKTNQRRGHFWQNVTGSVEKEESFEAAALREAQEESGLVLETIIDFLSLEMSFEFKDRWGKEVHEECFLLIAEKQWKPTLDHNEHEDWRWISHDQISEDTVKYQSNLEALKRATKLLLRMGP